MLIHCPEVSLLMPMAVLEGPLGLIPDAGFIQSAAFFVLHKSLSKITHEVRYGYCFVSRLRRTSQCFCAGVAFAPRAT
jgi:hypothetical protein